MNRWLLISTSVASVAVCIVADRPTPGEAGEIPRLVGASASESPPVAAPRGAVQIAQLRSGRSGTGGTASADPGRVDSINRAVDQELLNQALNRELTGGTRATDPGRSAVGFCIYGPLAADPIRRSLGVKDYHWGPEIEGLQLSGAYITYSLRELPGAGQKQAIRFHVENQTLRRASIVFHVDIVSNAGTRYTNMLGAMIDPQRSLSGSELEIVPLPTGECIAEVRVSNPTMCDESGVRDHHVGGKYQDSCETIPAAAHTGLARTRAIALGSPPRNLAGPK
jgi:hypothetical protein